MSNNKVVSLDLFSLFCGLQIREGRISSLDRVKQVDKETTTKGTKNYAIFLTVIRILYIIRYCCGYYCGLHVILLISAYKLNLNIERMWNKCVNARLTLIYMRLLTESMEFLIAFFPIYVCINYVPYLFNTWFLETFFKHSKVAD